MKLVLTGGGTGGHITPILAVAHELKRLDPALHIVYIGERGGKYTEMTAANPDIDEIHTVFAGKFRRYHGESWVRQFLDLPTLLLNLRDLFYFILGTLQALVLVRRLKPDVVLLKGGFVGVPTGLAAAFWKRPFVTHDSDVLPGLANRIVARWATYHATALPAKHYSYPAESVRDVGVLVSKDHGLVTPKKQAQLKEKIGLPPASLLLLITGGSGGAERLNQAVRPLVPRLLQDYPNLYIVHQVGKGKKGTYQDFSHERLRVEELLFPLYAHTGASDVVVTRAGATTMAELGVQGRACIVVPNPLLTGGHQIKNAEKLKEQGAVRVVDEATLQQQPQQLNSVIRELLDDKDQRQRLGQRLSEITPGDAAYRLAVLLLEVGRKKSKK
jgi:UDP-N-acetylglucosamine--N-acetylmuramyl-(pentapeptide) pyrophosphoryl-undecaprenol N-acetylglucosamine transferase